MRAGSIQAGGILPSRVPMRAAVPVRFVAVHLAGLAAVTIFVVTVTALYVSAEHTFYAWDFHEYTSRLESTYGAFLRSPTSGLVEIYLSTSKEYNLLPTIPLLPLRAVLGEGRLAYEINAAIVFIVPFVLVTGWLASSAIGGNRGRIFWLAVAIALAVPFTWVSTLRGFVDLGSAALVAAAMALFVGDPRLSRPWRPIAIGVLLAAAVLFRRPFAYDGLALCAAIGLMFIGRVAAAFRAGSRPRLRPVLGELVPLGLIAGAGLVTLLGIGHRLVGRLLLEDYGSLYADYVRPPLDVLGWLGAGFGWVTVVIAVAGFAAARRAGIGGERLSFVGLYGLILVTLWTLGVGQEDVHYAAHFVAPVVVGLVAFAWALPRLVRPVAIRPAVAALALLLALGLVAGLSTALPGAGSFARSLLPAANPPLVRADYDTMVGIVEEIRRLAGSQAPVLVIGSTDNFSDDTVVVADAATRGTEPALFVLTSPHVDSRDTYPLAVLLAARVVVLPDPLPLPLAPEHQGVQRALHDLFASESPAVAAFTARPGTVALDDGLSVRLFERTRPSTLDEALAALALMRSYTPTVPGGQAPWISVGGLDGAVPSAAGLLPSVIETGRDGDGRWVANSLIYIGASAGTTIDGSVEFFDRTCGGVTVGVESINGTIASGSATTFTLKPGGVRSLQIAGLGDGSRDLLLTATQLDDARPCPARILLVDDPGDRASARSMLVEDDSGAAAP